MNEEVKDAKSISIRDYLEARGIKTEKVGTRYRARSPFSRDTNPSFLIYPTNTYHDWSTGRNGDIIDLVKQLEGCTFPAAIQHLQRGQYRKFTPPEREETKETRPFNYKDFITHRADEIRAIRDYAGSRGICEGYENGVFFTRETGSSGEKTWIRHPSLGFLHRDKDLQICGIKLREINPKAQPRFNARGLLGLYILNGTKPTSYTDPVLYVVEGEANANSLWMSLKKTYDIISIGGATGTTYPLVNLPPHLQQLPKKKLIIDYDGNEQLYQERLKLYEHLNAEPIKLMLPKGEDINSLYMAGKMYLIDHLL